MSGAQPAKPNAKKINTRAVVGVAIALVLVAALIVAGVNGSRKTSAASDPTSSVSAIVTGPSATSSDSSTSPTPSTTGFTAALSWNWQLSLPGGYQQSGKLSVGALAHAGTVADVQSVPSSAIADCDGYDAQTTAVMPFSLDLSNDVSFSQAVSVYFARWPAGSPQGSISIVYNGQDGVGCTPLTGATAGLWSAGYQLQPNASINTEYGYIVLGDYYSPDFPNGNPAIVQNAIISMPLSYRQDGATLTQFSGSGIPADWLQTVIPRGQLAEFPLSGNFPG